MTKAISWRWIMLGLGEAALFGAVALAFWQQEWRDARPTPRPSGLVQPPLGAKLATFEKGCCCCCASAGDSGKRGRPAADDAAARSALAEALKGAPAGEGPVVLHFFNLDCPCSRFNMAHLRELRHDFAGRARFVVVLEGVDEPAVQKERFLQWALDLPAVVDVGGAAAAAAGVYSTPQAVVLDAQGRLFYRGNYNVQRYCTDPRTKFVHLALEKLLSRSADEAPVRFDPLDVRACTAYGCPLPQLKASVGGPPAETAPGKGAPAEERGEAAR